MALVGLWRTLVQGLRPPRSATMLGLHMGQACSERERPGKPHVSMQPSSSPFVTRPRQRTLPPRHPSRAITKMGRGDRAEGSTRAKTQAARQDMKGEAPACIPVTTTWAARWRPRALLCVGWLGTLVSPPPQKKRWARQLHRHVPPARLQPSPPAAQPAPTRLRSHAAISRRRPATTTARAADAAAALHPLPPSLCPVQQQGVERWALYPLVAEAPATILRTHRSRRRGHTMEDATLRRPRPVPHHRATCSTLTR